MIEKLRAIVSIFSALDFYVQLAIIFGSAWVCVKTLDLIGKSMEISAANKRAALDKPRIDRNREIMEEIKRRSSK